MRMSDQGRALLTKREGVRLKAYRDSVGVWTIGVGHTSAAGPPTVTPGQTITAQECDEIFRRDLVQYENAVNKAVKVPLAQHQFDACVSLCYNIGAGGFARSSVVRKINAGDMEGAADAFMMWVKPPEITGRRRTEVVQFRTPYSGPSPASPDIAKAPTALPVPTATPTTKQDGKEAGAIVTGVVVAGGGWWALWGEKTAIALLVLLALAAVYWFVVRPILRRLWALDEVEADFLTRLRLALKGVKTKLFSWLLGIAGIALPVLSYAGDLDLSAFLPDIAGVPASMYQYGILALIGWATNTLRNATTTPVGQTDLGLAPTVTAPSIVPEPAAEASATENMVEVIKKHRKPKPKTAKKRKKAA